MSPLDDELRRTLSDRAVRLQPAADPLAGIERRARRMRRNRLASVAASVIVLAGVGAVAVPALIDSGSTSTQTVFVQPSLPSAALDPASPWAYRGAAGVRTSFAPAVQTAWSAEHPGSTITPLFGQVYEPSAQPELLFLATGGGEPRWGFARQTTNGGTEKAVTFDRDLPLPSPATALVLDLGGDEGTGRILAVAAPDSRRLSYSGFGNADQTDMTSLAPGVGINAFGGDRALARVRVTGADGTTVYDQPVRASTSTTSAPTSAAVPSNVLSWPGQVLGDQAIPDAQVRQAFADAKARSNEAGSVTYAVQVSGSTSGGVAYTLGQAWLPGDEAAHTVGLVTGRTSGPEFFFGPVTATGTTVTALDLNDLPGGAGEKVVLVTAPGTRSVGYAGGRTGAFRDADRLGDSSWILDRSASAVAAGAGAGEDRVQVLGADGMPTYSGPLAALLCGDKGCG